MNGHGPSLVERTRGIILDIIWRTDGEARMNLSAVLPRRLRRSYPYLSVVFKKEYGITIRHFLITQRIERVKSLLAENRISIGEIAWKMGFASVQHLSRQFRKVAGMTPSAYRNSTKRR